MATPKGQHERPADNDAANDIDQTATLRVMEQRVANPAGRDVDPNDSVRRAKDSVDPTRVEGSADRAHPANRDLGGPSSVSAPVLDGLEVAVKARVVQTLFGASARPTMLGRYVVLGPLGQGGMGTVLEAFDRTLDRRVAIKVLHEDLDQEHNARLLREAQAMAKLSHPNVVQVFETDTVDGQVFVAMERVHGQTLRHWIRQTPPPDWRQCVQVFIQAGQGLAAAHAQGLVHRDFKPSNALIDDQGRVRVLDFGLARRTEVDDEEPSLEGDKTEDNRPLETSTQRQRAGDGTTGARGSDPPALDPLLAEALTETGVVMGTPAYMPPEQYKGHEADARSDQFSFCVSLYEAVYGERPFEGRTLTKRMASMTDGTLRPIPKGSLVPARLRTVLLRGLAANPDQRWPSMDALLHQLRMLVAPHSRRWIAIGMTTGMVALGGALALGQYAEVKDRCTGAPAQMDEIWDDDRREQVQAAILGTERSFAPNTWDWAGSRLDAYANAWMDAYTEACEATTVRGEQSGEALDLRMRCLDRRRTALRATIDVLADADGRVVDNAVKLVAGLPTLARCDDLGWLEQHDQLVPPPEDPAVAAAVEAQRMRLADIETTANAGRYAEALDEVHAVMQQAEALGYPPLRAEALHRRGELRWSKNQYAEAEEDLRLAHALAVRHHHDPVALDAAQALTSMVGYDLARHAEGVQWGEMEALPLAQRSREPLEEAGSLSHLSAVFVRRGDYDKAQLHLERALAIKENALGPDHPSVAHTLNNLGGLLSSQGDLDNARLHLERALAIWQEALGPDHPKVAACLNSLGSLFGRRGDLDNARLHLERALAIQEQALGPDHPRVARNLSNLGNVSFLQGDLKTAKLHYQRAVAIEHKALGPDHPDVARRLSNLGDVAYREGELDDARLHFERALAIQDKTLGPDHPDLATSLSNLGDVLHRQGELDRARAYLERALAIQEKAQGPDHPDVADPLVGLAMVALKTGDRESARAHAERAVSIREATAMAPALLAEARFSLAQALWSTPRERARARTLAEQAQDALAATEGPSEANIDLTDVETWLATHPVE